MSEPVFATPRVSRLTDLTVDAFISEYLRRNRPVIVAGAMRNWKALERWKPDYLAKYFGNERVQVYGDLFRLTDITTLSQYLTRHFGRNVSTESRGAGATPYVRWYCHLADDERVPWADEAFAKLSDDWARPAFFPSDSFVLPFCAPSDSIDPARDWFPARGLFISGEGARTRLHADPWCSDALLCQIYGRKDFVMYDPSQAPYLTNGERSVDVEAPDQQAFPDFPRARATVRDTLEPGEILLVPAGWYHHFKSASDSISLTWNFVHLSRLGDFLSYLGRGPTDNELKQLSYAFFNSPAHRRIEGLGFIESLVKRRGFAEPR